MDVWHWLLYAGASYLAVRSLLSLMVQHRKQYREKLIARERAERKRAKRTAKKRKTADPQPQTEPAAETANAS